MTGIPQEMQLGAGVVVNDKRQKREKYFTTQPKKSSKPRSTNQPDNKQAGETNKQQTSCGQMESQLQPHHWLQLQLQLQRQLAIEIELGVWSSIFK